MNKTKEGILIQKVDEMHKALMGNGQKGLLKEWSEHKGAIKAFKYLGGGGGIAGIASLIILLITTLGG